MERDQPHLSRLGNAGSRDYQIDDCPLSIRGAIVTLNGQQGSEWLYNVDTNRSEHCSTSLM